MRRCNALVYLVSLASILTGCEPHDKAAPTQSVSSPPPPITSAAPRAAADETGALIAQQQKLSYALVLMKAINGEGKASITGRLKKSFPDLNIVEKEGVLAPGSIGVIFDDAKDLPIGGPQNNHGLDADAIHALAKAQTVVLLQWRFEGGNANAHLKAVEETIDSLASSHHAAILDMTSSEFYSAEIWHTDRVSSWEGELPSAKRHFHIDVDANGDQRRLVTEGLAAFALPDLVIADLPEPSTKNGGALINGVAQLLAEGKTAPVHGKLDVDLTKIRYDKDGPSVEPKKAPVVVHLLLNKIANLPSDPRNRLYQITFPDYPGATETERLTAALDAAFGAETDNPVAIPEAEAELAALKLKVQAMLPALRDRFQKGVPPGEHLSFKVPFEIDGGGGQENMWVVVNSWDPNKIHGILDNEPSEIKALRAGAHVDVDPADIKDYAWFKKDGSHEGAESADILTNHRKP